MLAGAPSGAHQPCQQHAGAAAAHLGLLGRCACGRGAGSRSGFMQAPSRLSRVPMMVDQGAAALFHASFPSASILIRPCRIHCPNSDPKARQGPPHKASPASLCSPRRARLSIWPLGGSIGRYAHHGPATEEEAGRAGQEEAARCAGTVPTSLQCSSAFQSSRGGRPRRGAGGDGRCLCGLQRGGARTRQAPAAPAATQTRSFLMSRRTRRTTSGVRGGYGGSGGAGAASPSALPMPLWASLSILVARLGRSPPFPLANRCYTIPVGGATLPGPPHVAPLCPPPVRRRLPPRARWREVQGWALHRAAQAGVGPLLHGVDGAGRAGGCRPGSAAALPLLSNPALAACAWLPVPARATSPPAPHFLPPPDQ